MASDIERGCAEAEAHIALVHRFYAEIWNEGHLEHWSDFLDEDEPLDALDASRGTYQAFIIRTRRAYPDLHWTVQAVIANGDSVAWHASVERTNSETGQRERIDTMTLCRVVRGKLTERVGYVGPSRPVAPAPPHPTT